MQSIRKSIAIAVLIISIACIAALPGCQTPAGSAQNGDGGSPAVKTAAQGADASDGIWMSWDEAEAPNYVLVVGEAEVGDIPDAGEIIYGELDGLGRTTYAVGNITKALRDEGSANGHDSFGAGEDPSGWPDSNPEVEIITPTGKAYHGYLWNRSHMIADSLGGEAIKRNAVTGTRMQNVGANNGEDAGGMAFCEVKARKWLDAHPDGTLYYRADAMYAGDELIPRAVIVNMRSSDGELDMQVVVYNAAKGFDIDYHAADSTASVAPETSVAAANSADDGALEPSEANAEVYVTKSGRKYHLDPDCQGLSNASEVIPVTVEEARARGLEPCGICGH